MSCPYTATDRPANVSIRPVSWARVSINDGMYWPAFGWANSSLHIGMLFPQFSVWDFEGRDIKYCNTWSAWCSDLETIFKDAIFLRICSLYPNITSDISTGQLGANWTSAGFNTTDLGLIRGLNSQIPSCLISYCALIPGCAATRHCLNANLYASDESISMAGMKTCTYDICYNWKPVVNSDFGGIGMLISYLIQTLIALLGFAVLASIHLRRHLAKKRRRAAEHTIKKKGPWIFPSKVAANPPPLGNKKGHSELWIFAMGEFHKLQCYYAIALLIASFVALYSRNDAERAQLDDVFLMLISANGLIPVSLTFYTLMLERRTTPYHVVLAIVCALLASTTGFWIVKNYSLNQPATSERWPDTCGALSPQYICGGYEFEMNDNYSPQIFFAVAATLCDMLILYLVVWYNLRRSKNEYLARLNENLLPKGSRTLRLVKATLHTLAVIILLACTTMELFFFVKLLFNKYSITDLHDWGFGQIVGITAWVAVIVDLARHEIVLLWEHRQSRRRKKYAFHPVESSNSASADGLRQLIPR